MQNGISINGSYMQNLSPRHVLTAEAAATWR